MIAITKLFFLFIVAALLLDSGYGTLNANELKAEEMYNCFFAILCKARQPLVFREIMMKAGENLVQEGFRMLKDISNISGSDTPEFWNTYPDYKCELPDETKKKYYMEWMTQLGELWANYCKEGVDGNPEECEKMGEAAAYYEEVNANYTANGVCQSQMMETSEREMKQMNDMASQGPGDKMKGMPSMG